MAQLCQAWIYVNDMDRALEWYCDVLGFEVSRRDYYPHCVELADGGGLTLGLHETGIETPWYRSAGPGSTKRPAEVDYWAQATITLGIRTDDLDRTMEELGAKGVEFVYPVPYDFYDGRWAAIKDPFGNVLELIELSKG